ncbi:MAG: acyl-CoA dehydrogenase family protein [Hyphomonadaceae bacterium]|nr:MAG: putative acyl-CoA dehydrogenase [Caulobacteraceae bacterium]MBT9444237.1 acyl-CoA dehydrogenase family protein [Hyphomonadaceae bacterium]TPW06153.1 MAG: putative acyl-CoA dehydrogenase [Alphaproteobacteria bacterium]
MHRNPRTHLATHEVTNQAAPLEDVNLFSADPILISAVTWSGAGAHRARLETFGAQIGSAETMDWCVQANRNPPSFKPYDRFGRRIDEVEFHPAYHELMALGLNAGVSAAAWNVTEGGHALHAALLFLMGQGDYGVCCPMSMSYAVVPALRVEPGVAAEWAPRVTTEAYDDRFIPAAEKRAVTMGMAMTEKQGGSDVRANSTRATRQADGSYELVGHKWFCSAPMSDAFLTLAYAEGGLTCFLAPRWRPDGERNGIEIQRLKDKLGDKSNASSEIEYRGAWAVRVGEEGRGVKTIIEMVQLTRLDCIIGAATQMRQAASLAAWHTQGRAVFQKKLIDQPLMRAVLADLALDVEASVALAFRLAQALDRADDPREAALARIGLPLAKYLVTKRAPTVVAEAMECLGGAGYVEEGPMPRLFRQSPLNAIWEGSGNVIALDTLRALAREPEARDALMAELRDAASAHRDMGAVAAEAEAILSSPVVEAAARHLAERLALALAAATLVKTAPAAVADAFIAGRCGAQTMTFGARTDLGDVNALIGRLALAH